MFSDNYNDAIEYLFTLRTNGTKLGLESIRYLLDELGSPDNRCDYIHVAGTNGKGSTATMIASILQSAGFKTGLFTSPHLVDFTERIKVNSIQISKKKILQHLKKIDSVTQKMNGIDTPRKPTFFEVVTALAVLHFAGEKCDVVIMETGMGGRLDATNSVSSCASVITRIDLDHIKWLGDNIEKITAEKAGIIKQGSPVFTSNLDSTPLKIISSVSIDKKCRLTCTAPQNYQNDDDFTGNFIKYDVNSANNGFYNIEIDSIGLKSTFINLQGLHQAENAALAAVVANWYLKYKNFHDSTNSFIKNGLENVEWPGRCQVISKKPFVLIDCAHNPNGIRQLVNTLKEIDCQKWIFVLGVLEDKNARESLETISEIAKEILYVKPSSMRGLDFYEFKKIFDKINDSTVSLKKLSDVDGIVSKIKNKNFSDESKYVITGSCYLIGDFMAKWNELTRDNRTDDPLRQAKR